MQVCQSCYDALDDAGAFDQYDAEGDDAGLYDVSGGGPAEQLAAECGADLPDHECDTWLYGGVPCPCSCHPQR